MLAHLHRGAPSIWKERSQGESDSGVVCVITKRIIQKRGMKNEYNYY